MTKVCFLTSFPIIWFPPGLEHIHLLTDYPIRLRWTILSEAGLPGLSLESVVHPLGNPRPPAVTFTHSLTPRLEYGLPE